jgi:TolB-like protein/class 3 adenylate cyclase/Tfp pilus assembly protein PilF
MSETRKLAAILVSDVVGYSRLAGVDEDRILARLRTLRSDLIDPTIAVHHGRIVKRTGDGSIIEFRSVVDAVSCAVEVQRAMVERNAGVATDRRIEFRIGVHLGDVVEESDGDLMGDGVNIAARLQGVATPGGICISDDAYRQVKSRLDLKVSDLGPVPLKNIAEPMRAYSLEIGSKSTPLAVQARPAPKRHGSFAWLAAAITALLFLSAAGGWYVLNGRAPKSAEAAHLSIVVLPFTNLSGDPAQDYFADGITENLTTDLSRLSGSFVIARNTAFTFKGKSVDAKEIGKELGVRYVLEGSVQRDQNQVRVSAQLVDAETGGHLWAERFDRPLSNLFSMQDDIVASLASQLGVELMRSEARRAERTPNPDSMDLYFQGMSWINKGRNPADTERGRDFFERALALDRGNLDAAVGMACADVQAAVGYYVDDKAQRLASVEANLNRVLSQSPNNARARYCLGRVLVQSKRGAQGIAECERALALNPNLASAHALIGIAKLFNGHPEETESHEREALRVSPHDTEAGVWVAYIALAKLHLGSYQEALDWYRRATDLDPNYATGRFNMAADLVELGRDEEARTEVQAGLALNPGFTIRRYRAGAQSDDPDFLKRRERMIEDMRKAGVPEG